MAATKLRPCPFCGSKKVELKVEEIVGVETAFVECEECEARGPAVAASHLNLTFRDIALSRWQWDGGPASPLKPPKR